MDAVIIIALLLAAVILFLVELFFIPGVSIAGIAGLGCLFYANYYAFVNIGMTAGIITLIVSIVACVASLFFFMRSKTLDKLALNKNITSKVDREAEQSIKVGDVGTCVTRLALIGQAEINEKLVEVRSADGFLDEKTPIVVTRIAAGTIFVEKQK
ncbi:nodulation efficiency protein D (NfeD) [Bacteroides sp. 214]|uniref:NfeD family protein n=1 Tax=Bacteroides sp. 214 TaxID=2302935 RepID=UPI0013D1C02E|nr:NfeD family protein [Bacteroides sp. 214]NDW11816.1 nodulation efficiency protein D (NfeD) [Bacteroides sp. 214]